MASSDRSAVTADERDGGAETGAAPTSLSTANVSSVSKKRQRHTAASGRTVAGAPPPENSKAAADSKKLDEAEYP